MKMSEVKKEYKCERCGHVSTTKGNLMQHLRKKTECPQRVSNISREELINRLTRVPTRTKTYECEHCHSKFSTPQGRSQHKKICSKHPNKELARRVDEMEEIIKNLQQELAKKETIQTNHIETMNNTNTFNININVNNFGQENTSYLTPEFLTYCVMNPKKGISSLIESIHYNKDYPENHNLRCRSLKDNVFEKLVDTRWTMCDASNTLDELIKKGYRILESHLAQQYSTDPDFFDDEDKVHAMQRFRIILTDKQSQDYYAVKRDLRLLVKDKTMYLLELIEQIPSVSEASIDGNT